MYIFFSLLKGNKCPSLTNNDAFVCDNIGTIDYTVALIY